MRIEALKSRPSRRFSLLQAISASGQFVAVTGGIVQDPSIIEGLRSFGQ